MSLARRCALVFAGGMLGGSLRHLLTVTGLHLGHNRLWVTAVVNVVGAGVLGWLIAWWTRRATVTSTPLFVGTGLLGSFTTYSTVAVDLQALMSQAAWTVATLYAGVTLVGGLCAALLGWTLGDKFAAVRRSVA